MKENTEYEIKIKYTYNEEEYIANTYAKTKEYNEGLDFSSNTYGFNIKRRKTDEVLKTIGATFTISGSNYVMGDVDEFVIDGLVKDKTYDIDYTYTVLNTITNETYVKEGQTKTMSTLSYDIPSIKTFEETRKTDSKLNIKYAYLDPDNLVTSAYIMVNDTKYVLEDDSNTLKLENLDFANVAYNIQMFVEYTDPNQRPKTISSEILTYEVTHVHEWIDATCDAPKTCIGCGLTEGEKLDHVWKDATVDAPKTCEKCGKTEGEKLPPVIDEPTPKKKGCKKSSFVSLVLSLSLLTSAFVLLRKKK